MQVARRDVRQCRFAVFRPVHRQASVARVRDVHGLKNPANGRKQPRAALLRAVQHQLRRNVCLGEHPREFVKRQHRVHRTVLRLVFFGEAGTDEHCLCVGNSPLDILAVRNHRRHDRR
ncbi:hypothetical protein SDC9_148163 [bioreactor metagenome]|uniref:Uncharacterized protein n=1 Tax=bioreactor metagenome TaxID=1076179 RepID=A0A645EG02_9ZZZZ